MSNVYDERTAPHRPRRLVVNQGDVRDMGWEGQPISFLFVDVAKTPDIWAHVAATWVPALERGGILVQQDWSHAVAPWLHDWHRDHGDRFDVVCDVPYSGSRVFRVR